MNTTLEKLLPALIAILSVILTAAVGYMGWQAQFSPATVLVIATGLATAMVAWLGNHFKDKRINTAETLSPGITTEKISPTTEVTVTREKNDTYSPDPAEKVTSYTPPLITGPNSKGPP